MRIDLNKGVNIRISGELGKFNSIPVDALVKISQNFQDLILSIAKNDIQDSEAVDLNNFKVELSGFKTGSAVPQFIFTQRVNSTISDVGLQRKFVNEKFEKLIGIANEGSYGKLKDIYPDSNRRNNMVNSMYSFVNSFGSAPVSFVEVSDSDEITEVYKIKKFKSETKKSLIADIKEATEIKEENYAVGKIKLTTSGKTIKKKIEEIYTKSNTTLSYSPDVIVHNDTSYILNFPLRCSLEKEDDYYLIQSELLDIVGTGETEDDAELNFAEEFSFIYKRYNELEDSKLSGRITQIKSILNYLVKEVE
ncbi:MAG: hypothetical protein RIF36_28125 [Imperialibacter sp.]|uniref:hypothetical protein n=1 Tax=Imperialibacter sp. TaxID=2038411 RepID=UPI0032EC1797